MIIFDLKDDISDFFKKISLFNKQKKNKKKN